MMVQGYFDFYLRDIGLMPYAEVYALQKHYVQKVLDTGEPVLILCEHPSVLTMGRLADQRHILLSKQELGQQKISVEYIDRGGEVTLHSPGQLVAYPILDLRYWGKDLHAYMRKLEQVAIDLLEDFDIVAGRFFEKTGVWVGQRKIVSIGIGVRKWVSFHGIAINVNTDLNLFSMINPCGLDVCMTSMAEIQGKVLDMESVKENFVQHFRKQFFMGKNLCIR